MVQTQFEHPLRKRKVAFDLLNVSDLRQTYTSLSCAGIISKSKSNDISLFTKVKDKLGAKTLQKQIFIVVREHLRSVSHVSIWATNLLCRYCLNVTCLPLVNLTILCQVAKLLEEQKKTLWHTSVHWLLEVSDQRWFKLGTSC